jgi:hypothetical protein
VLSSFQTQCRRRLEVASTDASTVCKAQPSTATAAAPLADKTIATATPATAADTTAAAAAAAVSIADVA